MFPRYLGWLLLNFACNCNPANIYLFKASNKNTRKRCEICSRLTKKPPPEQRLFIKPGIQERGTECGECGEWAFRGMLNKIPGNAQQDSGECSKRFRGMLNKIPGNVQQDSGECSTRFQGMLAKIPGNVQQDSGECSRRFRGMFEKIPGNVGKDSGECSRRFQGMFKKIPGNVRKDSGECWQRFSRMLKKIGRFIMQLNQNRINGYILKYNQKYEQKLIKTSQMNEHV